MGVKLTIGGTIEGSQTWSIGLWCAIGAFSPSGTDLDTWCASLQTLVHTWWSIGTPSISTVTATDQTLVSLRASFHTTLHGPAVAIGQSTYTSPPVGTNGGKLGSRDAAVVTLLTGLAGRSFRGRVYVPCTGASLTTHQLISSDCTAIAQATAALITGLNGTSIGTGGVSVGVWGKQGINTVTSVRCDSKVDTQRRRSDKVAPLFVAAHTV